MCIRDSVLYDGPIRMREESVLNMLRITGGQVFTGEAFEEKDVYKRQISRILNGSRGAPVASIHVSSIVSGSATPVAYRACADFKNGTSKLFRM